jgi:Xaa-Pro aminopeptidase
MADPTLAEFHRRRKELMRIMGAGSIAILPAAPMRHRNGDVEYIYRPDSDFYYLTGFPEPEAVAVLIPGRDAGQYVLFVRERDRAREIWLGKRAGPAGATRQYGADDAFPIGDIDEILPGLLEGRMRVFYTMGLNLDFDQRLVGWLNALKAQARSGRSPPQEFVALDHVLHDMRLFKSRAELNLMRRSGNIAAGAHVRAMRFCEPGRMEFEVMAELLHEFHSHGADISYPPIVGGGANSCVLHYNANDARLRDGDVLLVDAGCEYGYYASDITRTYPINGRFTREQRAVYDIVLEAQEAAIAAVKPGNHWNEPHDAAVRAVTQGLRRIGLLRGSVASLIRSGAYKRFFMHRTGHWLGMDVHDVGIYAPDGKSRPLQPGMVLTVEPGLYIAEDAADVAAEFRGIGIRIEDDVLVTAEGHENLTVSIPKEVPDLEALTNQ